MHLSPDRRSFPGQDWAGVWHRQPGAQQALESIACRARASRSRIASWLYVITDFDGVTFACRHGDDLQLWAVFERPGDLPVTPNLHDVELEELQPDILALLTAFGLVGLRQEND